MWGWTCQVLGAQQPPRERHLVRSRRCGSGAQKSVPAVLAAEQLRVDARKEVRRAEEPWSSWEQQCEQRRRRGGTLGWRPSSLGVPEGSKGVFRASGCGVGREMENKERSGVVQPGSRMWGSAPQAWSLPKEAGVRCQPWGRQVAQAPWAPAAVAEGQWIRHMWSSPSLLSL